MPRVLVPLAEGFEEIETATLVDVLRRADIEVVLAGLDGLAPCLGSRAMRFVPDAALDDVLNDPFDLIVLPGGLGGTLHMCDHEALKATLAHRVHHGLPVAAVCAAPMVLEAAGILPTARYTCHPGVASKLHTPGRLDDVVVDDGLVLTSQSAGTAMPFALALVARLCGPESAERVRVGLHYNGASGSPA